MSFYARSPRIVMANTFVQFATVASSSVWFAVSVAAVCIAVIIPFAKRKLPPIAARIQVEAPIFVRTGSPSFAPPPQATVMVPKDGNYHIAADSVTGVLRRSVGRRPAPSAITIVPPVSGAITIVARPDCPDLAVTATFSPPTMEESQESLTEFTFSHLESELPSSTPAESSEAPESSASSSKRASLPRRMTGIFRHKRSGREGEKSVRSPSRSLSPTRQLVPDFKSEREESEIASGRVPHVRNLDDREVQQTKFVNPFKRKARPSSAGFTPGTPERTASPPASRPTSPPMTASMGPQRHRSLVSYFTKAVRPLHDASRSPSPRRWSTSSSAMSSDVSASSASSRRSFSTASASRSPTFPERSAHRTQPYGAPYYAAMPAQRSRRSPSARRVVELRQPISEGEESQEEPQSRRSILKTGSLERSRTVAGDNALVSLGAEGEAAHQRRHRSISIDDGPRAVR